MISISEAFDIVMAQAPLLGREHVPLDQSLGRVLADDVHADFDLPPFDRSAMDGYAVRARDVAVCPVALPVAGQIRAGQSAGSALPEGQAIQIMTGAPVPAGADAVQQVEKTRALSDGRVVEILEPVAPGTHIAPRGCEVHAGDVVLSRGAVIDPAAIAVLATAGQARVAVGRRPSVAVLVTGDELVEVGARPGPAEIRNSNGPAVAAQARWAGADVTPLGVVPDDPERIAEAVLRGLAADVLVVSGGVSLGVFDLVEDVLSRFGVELLFTKVAIKPGAPLVFGHRGATLVFGLPGNPVSAQVTFDLFVRPALLRMQGSRVFARPRVEVELLGPLRNRSGRENHLPARVWFEGGRLVAEPVPSKGSADVVAHARANALVVLDRARLQAETGERVPALLLGNFLERDGA